MNFIHGFNQVFDTLFVIFNYKIIGQIVAILVIIFFVVFMIKLPYITSIY